jgi:hypothetical protein
MFLFKASKSKAAGFKYDLPSWEIMSLQFKLKKQYFGRN